MSAAEFLEYLTEKGQILADGATGTNLFNMGLQAGEAPELWNEQEPDKVKALYQGSVDAGSDIFLTNSFGGNAARLKLHNAEGDVAKLNRLAVELAREVADKAGRKVFVAGSVGPTGEIMEPVGSLSHEDAVGMFQEQAQALWDAGADILWIETISAPKEFAAAAEAFANVGATWMGTMSFDTAGRTMMGVTSADFVKFAEGLDHPPVAYGANCGVGASDLLRTVLGFVEAGSKKPIIAKGNAGIPKYVDGHIHYDGTPELMADYAELARNCGAAIIGGCCGTMPAHLKLMRKALDERTAAAAPDLETIAAKLGDFSSDSDGTGDAAPKGRSRSRRRRR